MGLTFPARYQLGSLHVPSIEPLDAEAGTLDQFLDRAVQVTAAGQMLPGWGEMILPPTHARLRCSPMLDKEKMTIWPQYPTHLVERALDFGDAAHCPRRHDRIDTFFLNGNGLCSAFDEP